MSDPNAATNDDIDRFFRELVLCLGGIFAAYRCSDVLIRHVMKGVERIYERACARRSQRTTDRRRVGAPQRLVPHPAVEELLCRIGRSAG